jgi:ABC-type multidrug transport system permease subunit
MILTIYLTVIALALLAVFVLAAWRNCDFDETATIMVMMFTSSIFWPLIVAFMLPWYAVRAVKWLWLRVKGGV